MKGSENSLSEEDRYRKKKRGKKKQSGLNVKALSSHIISDEMYAHLALEDEVASNRDFRNISFNLLVVGDLEIISDKRTKEKEKATRIELLKHLAYKHEFLSQEEIINEYINFINKVEKGKFKWGSKTDLHTFEQNLIYSISVEACKYKKRKASKSSARFQRPKEILLRLQQRTV